MTDEVAKTEKLMTALEEVAVRDFGGHLTILRFTTNWRVGFWTPSEREDIEALAEGKR